MSVKSFNESFKMLYGEYKHNSKPLQESFQSELRDALTAKAKEMQSQGTQSIKTYEMAFEEVIENLQPDKSWWEVTDLNIFYDLFENRDIMGCVNRIIDNLKPEYKEVEEPVDEPITEPEPKFVDKRKEAIVNGSDDYGVDEYDLQEESLETTDAEPIKEGVGMDDVLLTLLHKYEKLHDKDVNMWQDVMDFIQRETIYSSDCMEYFKKDPREMFLYGMSHCEANDSYTRDFDDFVRGALEDYVSENISKFQDIHNGKAEMEAKAELDRIRKQKQ